MPARRYRAQQVVSSLVVLLASTFGDRAPLRLPGKGLQTGEDLICPYHGEEKIELIPMKSGKYRCPKCPGKLFDSAGNPLEPSGPDN